MDGRTDGRMDGWMGGWMDGWMDRSTMHFKTLVSTRVRGVTLVNIVHHWPQPACWHVAAREEGPTGVNHDHLMMHATAIRRLSIPSGQSTSELAKS